MHKSFTIHRGFTLIELLVAIAILAALATLGIIGYGNQLQKALDTQRKSDVNQYETSLQAYAVRTGGVYPIRSGAGVDITTLCGVGNPFADVSCQDDPDPAKNYTYTTDSEGINYAIWAQLGMTSNYYVVCSNGLSGEVLEDSWVVPTNGVCPSNIISD